MKQSEKNMEKYGLMNRAHLSHEKELHEQNKALQEVLDKHKDH